MFHIETSADELPRMVNGLPGDFAAAEREVERQIRIIGHDVLVLMQQPGLEPTYPIEWASDKQRKAFFATNGFGGGIPYKRDMQYEQDWKAVPIQDGVMVQNEDSAAIFVAGDEEGKDQSPIHKRRWPLFHDAIMTVLTRWQEGGWQAIGQAFVDAFLKDFRK